MFSPGCRTNRPEGEAFAALLSELDALPGEWRRRLSSLEPWDLTDSLLDALAASERFCRHLYLPLQSAFDRLLASMGRPYRPADDLSLLRRVRRAARLRPHYGMGGGYRPRRN